MNEPVEYLLRNQNYRELNPVIFGKQDCLPGHDNDSVRMYYLIHCVVSGKGIFVRGGGRHEVSAGQCFIARPYDPIYYRADDEEPWSYIWIGFTSGIPLPERLTKPVLESETAVRLFRTMLCGIEEGVSCPELFLASKLWELVSHFSCVNREEKDVDRALNYVEQAKNTIETEYMKELRIDELAERLHIDRSYFSTIFRRHTGVSPAQYLLRHRMNTAAMLLSERGYSPSAAGRAVGYADPCNFSRMFRRTFGTSPSEYRKSGTDKKG